MDRQDFIELAPIYYAGAIYAFVKSREGLISESDILQHYSTVTLKRGTNSRETYYYLSKPEIFRTALVWLRKKKLVKIIEDPFVDPMILRDGNSQQRLANIIKDDDTNPLVRFVEVDWNEDWIKRALRKINDKYVDLHFDTKDFDLPNAEWEPLPLDRSDPRLSEIIHGVDEIIETVRGDNGYAATLPEERSYVLTTLSTGSKILGTENSTSIPALRTYVIDPLVRIAKRFKDAALGVLADGTRAAIIEYVKQHAPQWAASLIHTLFS
ncbi:MAG: hypothetical protein JO056_12610 [Alphaproteobacteria bacterium]|nr:hypothetical protein [Alphaproteobacteria bacterium]